MASKSSLPPVVPDSPEPDPSPVAKGNGDEGGADGKRVRPTDLAGILRTLALGKRTGTLKVSGDEGQIKYLYFRKGSLELLKTPRAKTLLGKALVKCGKITPEQLRKALGEQKKRQGEKGEKLGHIVRRLGLATADDVRDALAFQTTEEVLDLFTWARVRGEFIRGDPPLDIFDPDDLAERVSLSPIELAEEAESRVDQWEQISQIVPSLHDVYAPTPEAKAFEKKHAKDSSEREILKQLDGVRDITEVLEQVPVTDTDALIIIAKMVQQGALVPLNALQLFGIAEACEHDRQLAKALRLYSRAEELGLERPDLAERMGRVHLALGDVDRAVARYVQHAELALDDDRFDAAVHTLTRVLEIAPDREDVRENLVKALIASGRGEEAVDEYERLAESYAQDDDGENALHAWQEIVRIDPSNVRARGEIAAIYIGRGDVGFAIPELEELSAEYLARGELEAAIQVMEKILELDPECLSANMQLATTFTRMGQVEKAIAQYLRFARTLQEGGLTDHTMATLIGIYEKIVELDPDNTEAREFLAQTYLKQEEFSRAIDHYEEKARSLRNSPGADLNELAATLEQILKHAPKRTETARELARTLGELGRREEAVQTFHQIALQAVESKDYTEAAAIYEEVLLQNPFDLEAHVGIANLRLLSKEHERAAKKFSNIGDMCLGAGLFDDAEGSFRKALEIEPERADLRMRMAEAIEKLGRAEEAARELIRASKFCINDEENFGLAKKALRRARSLDPGNEDVLDLLDLLQRRRSGRATRAYDDAPARVAKKKKPAPKKATGPLKPTITGGAREAVNTPTIFRPGSESANVVSIAERLKGLKLGAFGGEGGDMEEGEKSSAKFSGLSKLKALQSGASEGTVSEAAAKTKGAMGKLRELASANASDQGTVSQAAAKSKGAMEKLRELSGGPKEDAGKVSGSKLPSVSRGPEAEGDAIPATTSKATTGALGKLKAMTGGVKEDEGTRSASALPNLDREGEAAEEKATVFSAAASDATRGALDRLRSLGSGGGGGADEGQVSASSMPQIAQRSGEAQVTTSAGSKTLGALGKLKSLSGGGGGGADGKISSSKLPSVSAGPDGPGEAATGTTSKATLGALGKLKALSGGGGGGEASTGSKSTLGALGKLKALKGGAGDAGGGAGGGGGEGTVSAGPEGPGETASAESKKKTLGALGKLKALKIDTSSQAAPSGQSGSGEAGGGAPAETSSKPVKLPKPGSLAAAIAASTGGGGGGGGGDDAAAAAAVAAALARAEEGMAAGNLGEDEGNGSGDAPVLTGDPSDALPDPSTDTAAFRIASISGVSDGPESPGSESGEPEKKKTMSALDKLKRLKGGGSGDASKPEASAEKVSKGPEAPGEATSEGAAKKTLGALGKLKSLKGGLGS